MPLGETLLTASEVTKAFGDKEVLKNASFTIHRGARIGIIGANGCGKSTFMRILAGEDKDFRGAIKLAGGVRVGYVSQEPVLDPTKTVRGNVEIGIEHIKALLRAHDEIGDKLGDDPDRMEKLLERMGNLQEEIERIKGWEWEHQLELAMEALGLPEPGREVGRLSGGERRRVALCRELISRPDLLILDEPTNHLDAATVEWLENFIDEYEGTVVMVTHDRYFLDNEATYMVELENGRLFIYEGNYSAYLERKSEVLEMQARTEKRRQGILRKELDWLRASPSARTTKSKARVKNYDRLFAEGPEEGPGSVQLTIPSGPRLGNRVLHIKNLQKSYGDKLLIDGLNLDVAPGEIVGITGPNGSGKTTLFRMILGQEKPDAGSVELGPTVKVTYVDQTRDDLNADKTVYEEVSDGRDVIQLGSRELHVREYLSGFQFKGSSQQTPVGKLSGGERNRLLLAKTLRRGANLILLDEPTNDLDLTTLRVLEEALENFAGSAMIVSHDRFFLDRLSNSLIIWEEASPASNGTRPRVFNSNFEHYFDVRRKELDAVGMTEGKMRRTSYRKMARR